VNAFAFVLLLIAAVLFGVAAILVRPHVPAFLVYLGLCLLTIGLIVQFASSSHSVTF
jgi:hypothetical protein